MAPATRETAALSLCAEPLHSFTQVHQTSLPSFSGGAFQLSWAVLVFFLCVYVPFLPRAQSTRTDLCTGLQVAQKRGWNPAWPAPLPQPEAGTQGRQPRTHRPHVVLGGRGAIGGGGGLESPDLCFPFLLLSCCALGPIPLIHSGRALGILRRLDPDKPGWAQCRAHRESSVRVSSCPFY